MEVHLKCCMLRVGQHALAGVVICTAAGINECNVMQALPAAAEGACAEGSYPVPTRLVDYAPRGIHQLAIIADD